MYVEFDPHKKYLSTQLKIENFTKQISQLQNFITLLNISRYIWAFAQN